ncbi:MAG: chemotaxis protein CheW [Magnetococcales bacterium]|nr:chemotaxis protein CheW [Magnetococcales bacterium]
MANELTLDTEFLVFTANHNRYGVPHLNVVAVMDVPEYTCVPCMPAEMRGVIPFQERSIPLFDLRICFGEPPRAQETDELKQTMALRKQDHINWLDKLKDEVFNGRPITVQTNPHLCAFGKWYDRFHTDNLNLSAYMQRFDTPHQQIHQVAVQAAALIRDGRTREAEELIHLTEKGLLTRLIDLFDGIGGQIRQYLLEYALVLQVEGEQFAVAVDDINYFSRLHHIESRVPTGMTNAENDFVQAIGRYREDGNQEETDILLLDVGRIVNREEVDAK